jgi:hypothetical protein
VHYEDPLQQAETKGKIAYFGKPGYLDKATKLATHPEGWLSSNGPQTIKTENRAISKRTPHPLHSSNCSVVMKPVEEAKGKQQSIGRNRLYAGC